MIYGSVCSGIEAATMAWHPLGWKPAFFSEIEPFPRAVLDHHYPEVPLHGDFTTIKTNQYRPIDLLVGGTPCQSFSIAGLRGGMDDSRGNLALEFLKLAKLLRPRWVVWENVPGVLSSNGGRDFGSILAGLGEVGYGFAYRVLDAQYFGLAQRRKRVFVVGYIGDWRPAAAVLFERESLRGNPAPSREKGQATSNGFECGPSGGRFTDLAPTLNTRCKDGPIRNQLGAGILCADIAPTLNAKFGEKQGLDNQHIDGGGDCLLPPIAMCLNAGAMGRQDSESETLIPTNRCGEGQAIGFDAYNNDVTGDLSKTVDTGQDYHHVPNVLQYSTMAFGAQNSSHQGDGVSLELCPTLDKSKTPGVIRADVQEAAYTTKLHNTKSNQAGKIYKEYTVGLDSNSPAPALLTASAVRRLTPTECERLQGFPDGYTAISWKNKTADQCPDGPRYKALGNSMAVPVMRWIGERIQKVEETIKRTII